MHHLGVESQRIKCEFSRHIHLKAISHSAVEARAAVLLQRQQALHLGCHESLVLLLLSKQDSVKHAAIAGLAVLTACQSSVFEPAFCTTLMKEGLRLITGGQCPVAAFQLDACYSIVHVCMRQQQESSILVRKQHLTSSHIACLMCQVMSGRPCLYLGSSCCGAEEPMSCQSSRQSNMTVPGPCLLGCAGATASGAASTAAIACRHQAEARCTARAQPPLGAGRRAGSGSCGRRCDASALPAAYFL